MKQTKTPRLALAVPILLLLCAMGWAHHAVPPAPKPVMASVLPTAHVVVEWRSSMPNPQITRGTSGSFTTITGSSFTETDLYAAGSWNGTGVASYGSYFDHYTTNPGTSADGWGVSQNLTTGVTTITVPSTAAVGTNYAVGVALGGSPTYFPFDVVAGATGAGKSVTAVKQFLTTPTAVHRIRGTVTNVTSAPVLTLTHAPDYVTRTTIPGSTATLISTGVYGFDINPLASDITDTFFELLATGLNAGDAPKITDFRLYNAAGTELLGPNPPSAPTPITATAGNAKVTLNWGASTDADSYSVYRGTATGAEGSAPIASGITALTYLDSTAANGVTYYYYVAGFAGTLEGTPSAEVHATPFIPDTTPPATPTGLSGVGSHLQIAWTWNANTETDLAGYRLYVGGTQVYQGTSPSFTETGLTDGTSYTARVSAYDTSGNESAQSAPVIVKAGVNPAPITVNIVAPTTGSTLQGVIPFRVQADGGVGGISKVELYVSSSLVDSGTAVTTSPDFYDLTWDSTPSGNGTYTVYAKAYDPAANVATSTSITITIANPTRATTEYVITNPWTPNGAKGASIANALLTCHIVPATDSRNKRLITAGYDPTGTSQNFSTYTVVELDHQFAPPSGTTQMRAGFELAALYAVSPFTFAPGVIKLIPYDTTGLKMVIWASDGKLYLFDGVSTPTLLLDMSTVLLSGETVNDVCWFQGRLYLALSGGPSPLTARLYAYDLTGTDESYSVATFILTSSPTALVTDIPGVSLYIGTAAGQVHTLDASGNLKVLVGKTTALPFGVSRLIGQPLAPSNVAPGVGIATSDGSLWDIDASDTTHGAKVVYAPIDGTTAVYCGTHQTDPASNNISHYLGTGATGNLYRLAQGSIAYTVDFNTGFPIRAIAAYSGTVYFGGGDTRLWGKILDAGAHTLAYGTVTDPLPGVTSITSMMVLKNGNLYIGSQGTGNNLTQFNAPTESALATYGYQIKDIGLIATKFA